MNCETELYLILSDPKQISLVSLSLLACHYCRNLLKYTLPFGLALFLSIHRHIINSLKVTGSSNYELFGQLDCDCSVSSGLTLSVILQHTRYFWFRHTQIH